MESPHKEEFLKIFEETIKTREGSDKLLKWILKSDFFVAPASTKYHGSYEGGLVEHCINVYNSLLAENDAIPKEEDRYSPTTIAVCALLHDLCKVNYYKKGSRNVKNEETGQWEKKEIYEVDDKFPVGHGEKSVFLIQAFIKLNLDEVMAIRWHMGGFDSAVKGGDFGISKAYESSKLAVLLHVADMKATYLLESRGGINDTTK
jgi:HD superfamily phosphohydrolase YqeK